MGLYLGRSGASPKATQSRSFTHDNLIDLQSDSKLLPPISSTSSHESKVVTTQANGRDDIGQSVLQFVLPDGMAEPEKKTITLVDFPASSNDRIIEREATPKRVTMTSEPIHNSHDFP